MAKTKNTKVQISVNSDELSDFIKHIIKNNQYLQEKGKVPIALEVKGGAGIGKTSLILQIGEELGLPVAKVNLAQIEELGDVVGFPLRQFEMCKNLEIPGGGKETVCEWVDEHAISEFSKNGYSFTGNKRMSYAPPEWIANRSDGGILLLDDCLRADVRFQQAIMDLVDRQEYISWKLPNNWHIILSNNPSNGDYLVNELDVAQRTRYITTNLKWDKECWARWAERDNMDGRCINFVLRYPEVVTEETNARALTKFFYCISSIKDFEKELELIQMIGEGSVGMQCSSLFTTFIANKLDKLIDPKTMFAEKDYRVVREKVKDCIGDPYRADIAAVLTTRILNYSLTFADKGSVGDSMIKRLGSFLKDDLLGSDQKYYLTRGLTGVLAKGKFQALYLDKEIGDMIIK